MNDLFYLEPALNVNEAIPTGNGRIGCIVFGGAQTERLVLNEETLWSGRKRDRINPESFKKLSEIRKLILSGNEAEAEKLALSCMTGTPPTQRRYRSMCDITINMAHKGDITNYSRSLDLDTAVATVKYECGGTTYKREVFASYPANCVIVKLTAQNGKLDFVAGGKAKGGLEGMRSEGKDGAVFFGGEGIKYACAMRVVNCDGKVSAYGGDIIVSGATNATLLITAATDWNNRSPFRKAWGILKRNSLKSFEDLLSEHIADYKKLYSRVALNFGVDEKSNVPTDKRLKDFADGQRDAGLIALYFNFGRYLLISSSRQGGLPANLQGIWNEEPFPCWDSKYTININLEMNYWHANVCGLDECYEPFFTLLERVRKSGKRTAKRMYGCKGFVAHHNTDITADTAPTDRYPASTFWALGGAWLALNIYDYYLYTGDKTFLQKNYRILKDAVLFFKDFLIEDNESLVTCPSLSPENSYIDERGNRVSICAGPTSDTAILTRLFNDFIASSSILNNDKKLAEEIGEISKKLPPFKIAKDGRLMEWREERAEADLGHRHLSHLLGLFPANLISVEDTPELAEAARKSLDFRLKNGSGYTGWSCAWVICLKARLKDGEGVYESLSRILKQSTFKNLTDGHPRPTGDIFQIDGNFGATRGIAEMLLQSYGGKLCILPALPKDLPNGEVKGLRAYGGAIVDIKWIDGKAEKITVHATRDANFGVVYGGKQIALNLVKGEEVILNCNLEITGA